ncbi:MAG TPA: type II toxin-antitoxin system HicB family antitoxin [Geminicoccaceae bacterium]|nr:type II toxin-antitoxin system HicB family antitoxin [Geminicoccaceae bacterium]
MRHAYPFALEAEEDGSAVNVAFPDVPGARTFGADEAEARALAEDCLIAALGGYVDLRRPIPAPSPARGRPTVVLPPLVAAKLALYEAMRAERVTNVALADRLGVTEAAVRRLLDLDHRSHIDRIEAALRALGRRLEVSVWRAA